MNTSKKKVPWQYYWGWLPLVLLTVLITGMVVFEIFWDRLNISLEVYCSLKIPFFCGLCIAVLGIFVSGVWDLFKRRLIRGIIQLLVFVVSALFIGFTAILGLALLGALGSPSEDGFADHLTIPANISIVGPENEIEGRSGTTEDGFQQAIMKALALPPGSNSRVSAHIDALAQLGRTSPDILKRYFAASPSWYLFRENEKLFASRRWMIGSTWLNTMNANYARRDIDPWPEKGKPDFESGLVIGFSAQPRPRYFGPFTRIEAGDTRSLKSRESLGLYESQCLIDTGTLKVGVFERSQGRERRITKAALSYLNKEFLPLAASPGWSTAERMLPKGGIQAGNPDFKLIKGMQPGIYNSQIRINPGEPGMIYLKAFEVTHGTPLSHDRLAFRSSEYIGWSGDLSQLFLSNTHFTIYEGDWGKPYAARFEIWFTPDSGAPDRKLMEKIFKIEGWQR